MFVISQALVFGQNVNPDGSFSYSVPIVTPPGTSGMGPNLALSYNSNGGNGFLGVGWSLSGLSTVNRDSSYPINFDVNDHYIYNGQRLIPEAGNPYVFHTEKENFTRIEVDNISNPQTWTVTMKNGTRMIYGSTGANGDGFIDAVGHTGKARLWALSRVEDVHGNYYRIEYAEDTINGDFYPIKIEYTKNDANPINKIRTIELFYEERDDHWKQYVPTLMDIDHRLKYIVVEIGGNLLRKYKLDYEYGTSTNRSRLIELIEYGADGNSPDSANWLVDSAYVPDGTSLPSVEFNWGETANKLIKQDDQYFGGYTSTDVFYPMDFNGDGMTDVVEVYRTGDYLKARLLRSDGEQLIFPSSDQSFGGYASTDKFFVIDANGDGKSDIAEIFISDNKFKLRLWISDGTRLIRPNPDQDFGGYSSYDMFFPLDINGDGKTDIVEIYKSDSIAKARRWISNGSTYSILHSDQYFGGYVSGIDADKFFPMDVNGDGKTDIVEVYKSDSSARARLWISNGSSFIRPYPDQTFGGWQNDPQYSLYYPPYPGAESDRFYPMDVNADGLTDIVELYVSGDYFKARMWISNGSSFIRPYPDQTFGGYASADKFYPMDFNGDGKTDIVEVYKSGDNLKARLWMCDGKNFLFPDSEHSFGGYDLEDQFLPMDPNGDGRGDIVELYKSSNNTMLRIWQADDQVGDHLNNVVNKKGSNISINFKSAPQFPTEPGFDPIIPANSSYDTGTANKSPRNLVETIQTNDGLGNISMISYRYDNGLVLSGVRDETKNLGFGKIKRIAPDGSYVVTTYNQEPEKCGLAESVEYYSSEGNKYQKVENQYGTRSISGLETSGYHPSTFIFPANTYSSLYSNGEPDPFVTYRKQFSEEDGSWFDDWGNNTKRMEHGDVTIDTDDIITEIDYRINIAKYIIAPVSIEKNGYDLEGIPQPISMTRLFYDYSASNTSIGELGLLTKKVFVNLEDESENVTNEFSYNVYGNIISMKDGRACAGEYSGFTRQIEYDSVYLTFVTREINAAGSDGVTEYDNCMRPVKVIDPNGQEWETEYDCFGRVVKTIDPLDSSASPTTTIEYVDAVLDSDGTIITPAHRIAYAKDGSSDGYLISYTYFDGLGRQLQVKMEKDSDAGQWTAVDFFYDEMGRNIKTTVPYTSGNSCFDYQGERGQFHPFSKTVFDEYGRVIETINTDGTKKRIEYDKNLMVFIDENNHVTSTTVNGREETQCTFEGEYSSSAVYDGANAYSKVTTVSSPRGTIIRDRDGNELITTLNMLGQRESYSDPDMGTWTYTYDSNGNVSSQTDAKGQTINFEYDEVNRLVSKKWGAFEVSHYYYGDDVTTGHGYAAGRLIKVTYGTNHESYVYDRQGRVIEIEKSIDGIVREMVYSYDSMGRIVTQRYHDGEVVTINYLDDGNIESLINDSSHQYVYDLNYSAVGKVNTMVYGNGVRTDYSYYDENSGADPGSGHSNSFRLKNIEITKNITGDIGSTDYRYDNIDNIVYKHFDDGSFYYTEEFGYDEFNRLITAGSCELYGNDLSYSYDYLNNILQKDGRNYNYGSSKPHAVTELKDDNNTILTSYTYDANGNMISSTGVTRVVVRAKGTGVTENPPKMELWINGKKETSWIVTNTDYNDFTWNGCWDGYFSIDIVFANDNSSGGEDTDLYIDYIIVNGTEIQSDASGVVYDRGVYSAGCFDGVDIINGQEELALTGALRFPVPGGGLTRVFTYDYQNRLVSLSDGGAFTYDDGENRIKKIENGITTYYFFSEYEEARYIDENNTPVTEEIKYYFANGQRIAKRSSLDGLYYFHTDHLGSAVRVTDESGNIMQSMAYDPFGSTAYSWTAEELNTETRYQFTGQEHDESGIYYYGARYYDPALGRFLQADSVLDGLNRYAYCHNNPVKYTDPTGHVALTGLTDGNGGAVYPTNEVEPEEEEPESTQGSMNGGGDETGGMPVDPFLYVYGLQTQLFNYMFTHPEDDIPYAYPVPIFTIPSGGLFDPLRPRIDTPGGTTNKGHYGLDLTAPLGTPVLAAKGGVVTHVDYGDGYGNYIFVRHPDGNTTVSAHLKKGSTIVSPGDKVVMGQKMAEVGSTGKSTGPHLHFEIRIPIPGVYNAKATAIDPLTKLFFMVHQ
jgi:RHS repeat-associated protein